MKRGIDTSIHNGKITESVLNQVDFCIIRLGYGMDIANQDDKQFLNTVELCERLNKPWGAYIYSYAMSKVQAESEAKHALRVLGNRKPPMGLWFDMEDADGYKRNRGGLSKEKLVTVCDTFCSLTGAGIYASLSWLQGGLLDDSRLDKYPKWVAQWASKCTYKKPYKLWQYTSSLMIDGKRFDGNYLIEEVKPEPKKTNEEIAIEVINGKWGNGQDRVNRLTKAGYDAKAIQAIVNQKCAPQPVRKTNEEIAKEVIQGKYGNGAIRVKRLKDLGYNPKIIQALVNKMSKR